MKISRKQLRRIIQEEARKLNEQDRREGPRSDLTPQTVERYQQALHSALADLGYKPTGASVTGARWPFTTDTFRYEGEDSEKYSDWTDKGHELRVRFPKPAYDPASSPESDDEG